MKVYEYSTHFKVVEPHKGIDKILEKLTTVDFHTKEDVPLGYFYDKNLDVYRLPKGIGKSEITKHLGVNDFKFGGVTEVKDRVNVKMINNPFKKQSKVIDGIMGKFNNGTRQAIINMPTGRGKTFTGIYITYLLKRIPLIFVSKKRYGDSWIDDFQEHSSVERDDIYNIVGAVGMDHAAEHGHEYDVFIVTHRTVQMFIKKHGFKKFNKWLTKIGITLKIYDEFDEENKNMFNIDCHTSVPYTLYLSATDFRSSKKDDAVFQYVFNNVHRIGKEMFADVERNRLAHYIFLKSNPTKKERNKCKSWRKTKTKNGWGYKPHFDPKEYHVYLVKKKKFIKALEIPLKFIKKRLEDTPNEKHIFCTGRICNCEKLKKILIKEFDIDEDIIGIYNSNVDDNVKEKHLEEKPVIISLSNSMGRALDISDLKTIVDMESFGSESIYMQLVGRLGRVGGYTGRYFKLVDTSFSSNYYYYKGLKSLMYQEFKNVDFTKID